MTWERSNWLTAQNPHHKAALSNLRNTIVGCINDINRRLISEGMRDRKDMIQGLSMNTIGETFYVLEEKSSRPCFFQYPQVATDSLLGNRIV